MSRTSVKVAVCLKWMVNFGQNFRSKTRATVLLNKKVLVIYAMSDKRDKIIAARSRFSAAITQQKLLPQPDVYS